MHVRMEASLDQSLVERASQGDIDAFEELVRSHMASVYRLSVAILGSEHDAADATQEAFVAAWRGLGRLRDPDRFDAWLIASTSTPAREVLRLIPAIAQSP
jgi:RNA polymerase sigma-70 factor, ECF subfamily